MNLFPAVFVSHGSPMLALEPGATGAFFSHLGTTLDRAFGRPRAVLAVSAHSTARLPVLLGAPRHAAVHDFGGFPPALYELQYDAPGEPALAREVAGRLLAAGHAAQVSPTGGLDHGIWSVLRFMYPQADVPVVPLAWSPAASPADQMLLGEALAPLVDDGVLVLGTGSITHNLRLLFGAGRPQRDAPELAESAAFRTWFADRSAAQDWTALRDYRRQAPAAEAMHPTDEHLLPWFVAAAAGGTGHAPVRLHDAVTHGCIGMDAYAFGRHTGDLAAALAAGRG